MTEAQMPSEESRALWRRAEKVGWDALSEEERQKLRDCDEWEWRLRDFCGPNFLSMIPGFPDMERERQ